MEIQPKILYGKQSVSKTIFYCCLLVSSAAYRLNSEVSIWKTHSIPGTCKLLVFSSAFLNLHSGGKVMSKQRELASTTSLLPFSEPR